MIGNRDDEGARTPRIGRRDVLKLGLGIAASVAAVSAHGQARRPELYHWPTSPLQGPAPRERPPYADPILFWNDTALQLDALDHSIDAKDARAPGPCCAARAVALAHIVMADAAAVAYQTDYEGLYVRGGGYFPEAAYADVFIGGAAARILNHIYSTPAHTHLIGAQRQRFLRFYDSRALAAWNAGLEFGRNPRFTGQWHWPTVKDAALTSLRRLTVLRRGEHNVDPFNPDQKFYGANWGLMPPLTPGLDIRRFDAGPPPVEGERDYQHDLEEVRELGAYRPDGPTVGQVKVGLFWAYCGVRLIGTPARLYNQIIGQIAEHDGLSTPELARTFALCNLAMADAGIVCWEGKYRYRLWRPVLGIPNALDRPDPAWRPFGSARSNPAAFALGTDDQRITALSFLGAGERDWFARPSKNVLPYHRACFTPNFPSYPSGHASFGSAGFNMLKRLRAEHAATRADPGRIDGVGPFVSDEINGLTIDNFRNVARPYQPINYTRLEDMIDDNGKSRVYLGVHWNFDCAFGTRSGAHLAEHVYRTAYRRRRER